jgi:hypothetical protein
MKPEKLSLTVLLVCLFVICGAAPAMAETAPINGFLGIDWGQNLDQAKRQMIDRGATQVNTLSFPDFNQMSAGIEKTIPGYRALEALVAINGQSHFVVLSFYQDKFYRAYAERDVQESSLSQELVNVSDLLRQRYGAPQEMPGENPGTGYRWVYDAGPAGKSASIKLSLLRVPIGTVHRYAPKTARQSDSAAYYYIALEYEEKNTAAMVASKVEKPKPPINNSY